MSHTTKQNESGSRKEPEATENLETHRPARTALRNKIHHTDPADYEELDDLESFEKM